MLQSGRDLAFRETLYLMVLAFGRIQSFREASANSCRSPARKFIVLIGTAYRQGNDGVSIRTLADHTQLAATHVTTEVGRLIGKGLLTKQTSTRDRRSVLVRLTPQGEAAIHAINPLLRRVNDQLFQNISREDFAGRVAASSPPSRSTANMRSRNFAAPSANARGRRAQGRIETTALPLPPAARSITLPGIVTRGT
jgi:DNA-binding MarR family transcriptional regulator